MAHALAPARFREFFTLDVCGIGSLLAERNSALGKLYAPSLQLDYELRFRYQIDRCLQQEPSLARTIRDRLQQVSDEKRAMMGPLWWSVTYASSEFSAAFSLAATPLPPPARDQYSPMPASIQATLSLSRWPQQFAHGYSASRSTALESDLHVVSGEAFGGAWARAAAITIGQLDRGSAALAAARQFPACPMGRVTPRARILQNVFTRYYAGRVQPWLAYLEQTGGAWLDAQQQLLATESVDTPVLFKRWSQRMLSDGDGSLMRQLRSARERHVQAWQAVLDQCGLMPHSPDDLGARSASNGAS